MKKLATLLLAAGMVVASTAPASAADVKLDGFYRYTFQTASTGFQGENVETTKQRMRLGLTIAASENLSGYTQFQIGTNAWGTAPKHGKRDDLQTRQMYIDWKVPAAPVKVRMGRSQFGLPADAFGGNMVMGAGWGPRDGIVLTANATEWLDVTAMWARAAFADNDNIHENDHADVFGIAANLKFDGFSFAPWFAYSTIDSDIVTKLSQDYKHNATGNWVEDGAPYLTFGFGAHDGLNNSTSQGAADLMGYGSDSYYFGATATLTAFDPFKLVVSAAYGNRSYKETSVGLLANDEGKVDDRKGWAAQAKASYKLGFGTPILAAWYSSGDDANDQFRAGQLPGINPYSSPTGTFFDGGTGLDLGVDRYEHLGTWGVQAGIEGVSFLSGLTHTATVTWIQGTNNSHDAANKCADADVEAWRYMTTGDSVVELALTSDYAIYKNLVATLELAYLISDFDKEVWQNADGSNAYGEDDWRVGLTFTYKF